MTETYQQKKAKQHYARRKDHIKARMRAYYKLNPEKVSAHNALLTELREGRIQRQPCEVCGKSPADAHHPDYEKPLTVRWLCREHHKRLHGAAA